MSIVTEETTTDKTQTSTPKHSPVSVLEVRPVQQGSIRAYARIRVGAFCIAGVKVVQQPNQRPWVKLPDQQSKDGRWYPIVSCTSEALEAAIATAVLDAWQAVQP